MGVLDWLRGRRDAPAAEDVEPPAIGGSDEAAVAAGTMAFALALYRELSEGERGVFFSPSSITAALAMTAAGARGETEAELWRALRMTLPPERVHATLAPLLGPARVSAAVPRPALLPGLEPARLVEVESANTLWVQEGRPLRAEYLSLVREAYRAVLEEVDFEHAAEEARARINARVADATRGRIADIVPPGALGPLTRLALVNAIYFKRSWDAPFLRASTRDEAFHRLRGGSVQVPFMRRTGVYRFVEDREVQVLELGYQLSALSMVVVLPRKRAGLPELEKGLDRARVAGLCARLDEGHPREVQVILPRFRLEASVSLKEALQRLGARRAFERDQADFSGMTSDPAGLYVDAVLHRAFVEVNEEGTEAAAATAVLAPVAAAMAPPAPPPTFRADHPFLFLIRDARTGLVPFLGRVLDPQA